MFLFIASIINLNALSKPPFFSIKFFDFIPGFPPRASIQIPESSAKHGFLKDFKPVRDFIFAFSSKLFPLSTGEKIFIKLFNYKILIEVFLNKDFTSLILFWLLEKKITSFTLLQR